jgi:hypothetical protein
MDKIYDTLLRTVQTHENMIESLRKDFDCGHKVAYSTRELSKTLDVSSQTIKKWRNAGMIGYSKIGSIYFYSDKDVRDLLSRVHHDPSI